MVTYLSPFIPGLSILTAPPCELLRKDIEFSWDAPIKQPFNVLRMLLLLTLPSDTSCPQKVQVDASQVGLGAALLQNKKPVAFTHKVQTEVECRYANIECEMLAVVFGAEWSRTL